MDERRHENGTVYATPWSKSKGLRYVDWRCSLYDDSENEGYGPGYILEVFVFNRRICIPGDCEEMHPDVMRALAAVLLEAAHIADTGELPADAAEAAN